MRVTVEPCGSLDSWSSSGQGKRRISVDSCNGAKPEEVVLTAQVSEDCFLGKRRGQEILIWGEFKKRVGPWSIQTIEEGQT